MNAKWVRRASAAIGVAAITAAFSASAALAQSQGCRDLANGAGDLNHPANGAGIFSFNGTFASNEQVTAIWQGINQLTILVNGIPVITTNTPNSTQTFTITFDGPATVTENVQMGPTAGFVDYTCNAPVVVQPPGPPTGPIGAPVLLNLIEDIDEREPVRVERRAEELDQDWVRLRIIEIEYMFSGVIPNPDLQLRSSADFGRRDEARAKLQEELDYLRSLDFPPPIVDPPGGADAPQESILDDTPDETLVIGYMPRRQSPIDPTIEAVSQFFDFGGRGINGTFKLSSPIPGWSFGVTVDGGTINRASGGLTRQTAVGSITLNASTMADGTLFGFGLKAGSARATLNAPASALDGVQLGADLHLVRMLSPGLFGQLYGGYELGLNTGTIAGVRSQFTSHTVKVGGRLNGQIAFEEFTLTPAISTLLQYRYVPAFTDGAGAAVAAAGEVNLDVIAGVTVSRTLKVAERGLWLTPFATLNAWVDYAQSSGGPLLIGPDAFKLQAVAGVKFAWDNGMTASVQADITGGATTTMFGVTSSLSVPLQ